MDPVERLKTGFEKFKTEVYDQKPDLFEPLKAHQSPKYMVFACADSRVCPSVTLGLEPGEAFTVRNIAAMVPCYCKNKHTGVGSAIEYAVCALKVKVIVVIGHSRCGGIKALLNLKDGADDTFHFVEDWLRRGLGQDRVPGQEEGQGRVRRDAFRGPVRRLGKGGRQCVPPEPQHLPVRQGGRGQRNPQAGRRPLRLRHRQVRHMGAVY